jgi:hypothetical protein
MTAQGQATRAPTVLDLRRQFKSLYTAKLGSVSLVDVPPLSYLMIDGQGDPNSSQRFQDAVQALYTTAYSLKFALKRGLQALDYPVMALEGLWWADSREFSLERREEWNWTLMIMQPDAVTSDDLAAVAAQIAAKKFVPMLANVRLERYAEGRAAQILHVGPFAAEPETIGQLHQFITAQGLKLNGKHHEIYLSDPRRTAPEKLKTIIRQPIT